MKKPALASIIILKRSKIQTASAKNIHKKHAKLVDDRPKACQNVDAMLGSVSSFVIQHFDTHILLASFLFKLFYTLLVIKRKQYDALDTLESLY